MSSRCATFASVTLAHAIRPKKGINRTDPIVSAVEALLSAKTKLLSIQHDGVWRAILQFESVHAAVQALGDFGRAMVAATKSSQPFRIGIATGEYEGDTPDLKGDVIQRAIWLSGIAPRSGILLSRSTAAIAQDLDMFPYWVEFYGDLFNLQQGRTEGIWLLRSNQLPKPDPLPEGEDSDLHNIPSNQNFFIGREEEIEQISATLRNERWVTLYGQSGIGKSMLAQHVARSLCEEERSYRDGVRYVNLNGVSSREEVVNRLFESMGMHTDHLGSVTMPMIRAYFGSRSHLILLDGCERCREAVLPIIKSLLGTHGVSILATSTNEFNDPEEEIIAIDALAVPPQNERYSPEELEQIDSTALFLDRVRLIRGSDYKPDQHEIGLIVKICRLLKGHPLLTALTAKRIRGESLEEIYAGVKAGVSKHSGKPTEDRHDSPVALVDWIQRGLDSETRRVLQCAAVFEDRWSRDDLVAVTQTDDDDDETYSFADIAGSFEQLEQQGTIEEDDSVEAPERYSLMPHVRHAIRDEMKKKKAVWREIRERHFFRVYRKFRDLLPGMTGANQAVHLDRLDEMRSEFESALRFLIETSDSPNEFLEAMGHCWTYWYRRNRLTSAISLADAALKKCRPEDRIAKARLEMLASIYETKSGDSNSAQERLNRALKVIDGLNEDVLKSKLLTNLGGSLWASAEPERANKVLEQAVEIASRTKDVVTLTAAMSTSIAPLLDLGQNDKCLSRLKELERIASKSSDHHYKWVHRLGLGEFYCKTGQYSEAIDHLTQALEAANSVGDPSYLGRCYLWRSQTLLELEKFEEAAEDLGRCLFLLENGEQALYQTNVLRIVNIEGRLRKKLGDSELEFQKWMGAMHEQIDSSTK